MMMIWKLLKLLMLYCCMLSIYGQTPTSVSLNFQSIPLRALLGVMANILHTNIVLSQQVSGIASIHLHNVSPQQAYQTLLNSYNLVSQRQGEIDYILPRKQALMIDQNKLKLKQEQQALQSLEWFDWRVHYAQASELSQILSDHKNGLLSSRGHVVVDKRTNSLIIEEDAKHLQRIKQVLSKLDIPIRQVLIRAKIAIVNSQALQAFGVSLSTHENDGSSAIGLNDMQLHLPVIAPAGQIGFSLGALVGGSRLELALQALQSHGKGEIISAPKLIVANKHQAFIEQGDEVPFNTATASGATQVEFKKAVLGLYVTPQITPGNSVLLNLKVTKDFVTKDKGTAGNIAIIATSAIKTQVLVPDGETLVLGGVMTQQTRHDRKQVPFLAHIPVLGWLFRHTDQTAQQAELLIFVTPRVLSDK